MAASPTYKTMRQITQKEFDAKYIGSTEVASITGASRISVYNATKSGKLPEPLTVGKTWVWDREFVMPYIKAWQDSMRTQGEAQPA